MRGKGQFLIVGVCAVGITPAYAGKRRDSLPICFFLKDHPRLCGEKLLANTGDTWDNGSPPPMRGKGYMRYRHSAKSGITPAYAGKRITEILFTHGCQDHPRLCGEKQITPFFHTSLPGITPAYAGKSS